MRAAAYNPAYTDKTVNAQKDLLNPMSMQAAVR